MYCDKDGSPLSREEFFTKKSDEAYSRIGWTSLSDDDEEFVSTVWLGINHAFGPGKPVIFETMAYYDNDWQECRRYTDEKDAKKGHAEMVAEVMARRVLGKSGRLRVMDVEDD